MIVDFLFGIDLIVNFISSYEDPRTGLPVVGLKDIAINYLTSWFIIDFIAIFPTQTIEEAFKDGGDASSNAKSIKMVRLARLPRLYRLIRLLRMLKMLRVFRKSSTFRDWMNNLNISVGMIRLVKLLIIQFIMVHLMSCFWHLAATFEDNLHNTWVGGRGIVDSSESFKYLQAFYWAF